MVIVSVGAVEARYGTETVSLGDKNKKNDLGMKKKPQKFGGFGESRYLCTRNSEMNYCLLLQ